MGKLQTILFKILRARDITVTSIYVYRNYYLARCCFGFLIEKSSVRCHTFQSTKQRVLLFKQEAQFSEQIPSIK